MRQSWVTQSSHEHCYHFFMVVAFTFVEVWLLKTVGNGGQYGESWKCWRRMIMHCSGNDDFDENYMIKYDDNGQTDNRILGLENQTWLMKYDHYHDDNQ